MYRIKEDKRTKKSAELLSTALIKCLKSKPFSSITITDLQKESSVSRATFYRLFDSTIDIFYYQCDILFQIFLANNTQVDSDKTTIKEKCIIFFDYLIENEAVLINIINSGNIEVIYESHKKYGGKIVNYFLGNNEIDKSYVEFINSIFPSIVISFFSDNVRDEQPKTGKDFFEMVQKITQLMSDTFLGEGSN